MEGMGFVIGLGTWHVGGAGVGRKVRRVCPMMSTTTVLTNTERIKNMQMFKMDEKLLFSPKVGMGAQDEEVLNIVYAYPNEYAVGICSLGYQVVWAAMTQLTGVSVTRFFTDAMDMLPQRIDLLGVSMSWELDFVGLFDNLQYMNVNRKALLRKEDDPLVFGGGPVLTANPEPFAEFFDVILVGDGEELLGEFVEAWKRIQKKGLKRIAALTELACTVQGAYVPVLYEPAYESKTGPLVSLTPIDGNVPKFVKKRTHRGKTLAASTVISPKCAWENIHMVEAVRSCPEMCRFCLASYATLPFRAAHVDEGLIPAIEAGLKHTDRLGILGASITQHPHFDDLIERLSDEKYKDVRISISSVRTNTVTEKLAKLLVDHDSRSITVAVESGSERLRDIINKKLSNTEIYAAAERAQAGGLSGMKLYGMVGLPGERREDIEETIKMLKALKDKMKGKKTFRITFGCSTFVPKAHTPFQWFPVRKDADKSLKYLEKELRKIGVEFRPESYKWSVIQALISRGDRRVAMVLEKAAEYGSSAGSIKRAMKELKGQLPPLEYYAHEEWPLDAVLPWSAVQMSLSNDLLKEHRDEALSYF